MTFIRSPMPIKWFMPVNSEKELLSFLELAY